MVRLPYPLPAMLIQYNHNHPLLLITRSQPKPLANISYSTRDQNSILKFRDGPIPLKKINGSLLLYQKLGQHPESQRIPNQVRGHTHTQSEPQLLN